MEPTTITITITCSQNNVEQVKKFVNQNFEEPETTVFGSDEPDPNWKYDITG